jgi:hypothetical protein
MTLRLIKVNIYALLHQYPFKYIEEMLRTKSFLIRQMTLLLIEVNIYAKYKHDCSLHVKVMVRTKSVWTDARAHRRTDAHTPTAKSGDYVELTASGLDKNDRGSLPSYGYFTLFHRPSNISSLTCV